MSMVIGLAEHTFAFKGKLRSPARTPVFPGHRVAKLARERTSRPWRHPRIRAQAQRQSAVSAHR